eukprot:TRINITY_DN3495_c0_g1_i10.p1 TRINITY_DN3495_c0_g1~~TRINITY_DN3495_c0_g1_i10.p1  ORF type:complete len:358 (-),score=45.92 TRINITY_DN3495_c0_g1_i10:146-1090(-)
MGSARSLKTAIYLDGYKQQSNGYVQLTCHIENPRIVYYQTNMHGYAYAYGCGTDIIISVPNDEDPVPWKESLIWQEINVDDQNSQEGSNNYYNNYGDFIQIDENFKHSEKNDGAFDSKRVLKFQKVDESRYEIKMRSDEVSRNENVSFFLGFLERDFSDVPQEAWKVCRPFYTKAYENFPGDPFKISQNESMEFQCYGKPMNNDDDIEDCFCIKNNVFYTSCQTLLHDEYACIQESAQILQNSSWWVNYKLLLVVVVGWVSLIFPFLTCCCGYVTMRRDFDMGVASVVFGWALIINYCMFIVYCVLISMFNRFV